MNKYLLPLLLFPAMIFGQKNTGISKDSLSLSPGRRALADNTTGIYSTAIGMSALLDSTTGTDCLCIGTKKIKLMDKYTHSKKEQAYVRWEGYAVIHTDDAGIETRVAICTNVEDAELITRALNYYSGHQVEPEK